MEKSLDAKSNLSKNEKRHVFNLAKKYLNEAYQKSKRYFPEKSEHISRIKEQVKVCITGD